MNIPKKDLEDIKNDCSEYPECKAFYFIVYARDMKEAMDIIDKNIYAKMGEMK